MKPKKFTNSTIVTTVLIFASMFVCILVWATPMRVELNKIFILAMYGVMLFSFILRIALIFIGLFALYRIIGYHINDKEYSVREFFT